MRPLARAVVQAGLVSKDALIELRRWGLPVEVQEVEPIGNLDEVVSIIRDALEDGSQVRIQESDLDVLRRFLDPEGQQQGHLRVKSPSGTTSFPVVFCLTKMGEYVLPWKSESIFDMLTFGDSFLRYDDEQGKEQVVYFMDVRASYFGDQRAFMICTPEKPDEC